MSSPELRVLPRSDTGSRSITELFHRINSVLPDTQHLVTVQGETLASAALELLRQHGYSQLPVLVGTEVIGIFSYRSFSEAVLELCSTKGNPKTLLADLTVEECYESAQFARVTDEFKSWFDALDVQNAVLVGEAHRLQGIVTPMDVLRYLYDVSKPFVLVAEIETSLRALMRMAVAPEKLAECASTSLAKQYLADQVPASLDDMTFHDYVQIIGDGRNWPSFEPIFRGSRERTRAKLEAMNELRNDVFHFRETSVEDYERLAALRDWMLTRARAAESRAKGGAV
jgi:predicted transcriptional regulator